jgi:hypothetical protein
MRRVLTIDRIAYLPGDAAATEAAVAARSPLGVLRGHPTSTKVSFPQHHTAVDPQHLASRVSIGH